MKWRAFGGSRTESHLYRSMGSSHGTARHGSVPLPEWSFYGLGWYGMHAHVVLDTIDCHDYGSVGAKE
jgi:hypothetical protein